MEEQDNSFAISCQKFLQRQNSQSEDWYGGEPNPQCAIS
jgi:hypothetical protein